MLGGSSYGVAWTLVLASIFTGFQGFEYENCSYTLADGVFGSTFFMSTGFHGFHVIVGTIFLLVAAIRMIKYHFTSTRHIGYESGIFYWHFVDVVWIFLFGAVYYWGGSTTIAELNTIS